MDTPTKIVKLRHLMAEHGIDAWIIPSSDPHQSEYTAEHWQARAWLSGFKGSAGTVIITQTQAGLWTDARYHIRAALELKGSGIELFKSGKPGVPSQYQWLRETLPDEATIGFDGAVFSAAEVKNLRRAFLDRPVRLKFEQDLVSMIWTNRPPLPQRQIMLLDDSFAGETRPNKIQRIRDEMKEQGTAIHILSALDDICWTLNIRGNDVAFNPVIISYLVLTKDTARLFIHPDKVPSSTCPKLLEDGVEISSYDEIFDTPRYWPADAVVLLDPKKTNYKLRQAVADRCQIKESVSIPTRLKAQKNKIEIVGIRSAHVQDGLAMVKWLTWLEEEQDNPGHTELTLAEQLNQFRQGGELYHGPSFSTIIGFQANSAVGHYSPQPETTPQITWDGILLADSGGHYLNGTTDITRTVTFGPPTDKQKQVYTAVLKSLIKLSTSQFPQGTNGIQLDAIAREPLWRQLWECRHGIGHGVGHFLNVHEGPQRLGKQNLVPIQPDMVVTIEPGVYFEGDFGVRLENMVIVVEAGTAEFGSFYRFETLTLCPFDRELIDSTLLEPAELTWLNLYHQQVYKTLSPHLAAPEQVWLQHKTRPI